jgi:hypothetical protein
MNENEIEIQVYQVLLREIKIKRVSINWGESEHMP